MAKTTKELETAMTPKMSVPISLLEAPGECHNTNNQTPVSLSFIGSAVCAQTAGYHPSQPRDVSKEACVVMRAYICMCTRVFEVV